MNVKYANIIRMLRVCKCIYIYIYTHIYIPTAEGGEVRLVNNWDPTAEGR